MKRLILAVALAQMLGCEVRPECVDLPRPARCTCYADEADRRMHGAGVAVMALSCFEAYRAESGVIR